MTLALAVAALSSTALAILDRGDHDQAVFRVGADLRIVPGERLATAERRAAYGALPGAGAVTPLVEANGYLGQSWVSVTGINTARGPAPALRSDLSDRPVSKLVAPLGRNIPVHGLPLSGAAGELPLRVRLSVDGPGTPVPLTLTVHFVDADGLTRASEAVLKDTGGAVRTVRLKVPVAAEGARIVQLGVSMNGERVRRTYHLAVDRVPGLTRPAAWHDLRTDAPDRKIAGCPGAKARRPPGSARGRCCVPTGRRPARSWTRCCADRTPRSSTRPGVCGWAPTVPRGVRLCRRWPTACCCPRAWPGWGTRSRCSVPVAAQPASGS